jgi:hypothetical protein
MNAAKNQTPGGELVFEGRVTMACPIERAALRDSRLSWAARGLFAFLWDLPEGWRPCLSHLTSMGTDRVHATRSAVAELESVGAMRVEKLRGEGGRLAGQRWVVVSAARWAVEAPLKVKAGKGAGGASGAAPPQSDFPSVEFSDSRLPRASENSKLRFPKHKVLQIQGSPNTTTTGAGAAEPVVVDEESQRQLTWPAGPTEDQLSGMREVLFGSDWPGLVEAQALLDELAGQLRLGKVRNPPGLLRTLLKKQQLGTFTQDLGPEVRQAREARKKHAEREAAALDGGERFGAGLPGQGASSAGTSSVALSARENLRRMRKDWGRQAAPGGRV